MLTLERCYCSGDTVWEGQKLIPWLGPVEINFLNSFVQVCILSFHVVCLNQIPWYWNWAHYVET